MNVENVEKDNQLCFITWMQIIGCFLVILGHSYPFVAPVPFWAETLRTLIYSFHMALFVWCSGYLMTATKQVERYSLGEYVQRRARHLLIPYAVISLLGVLPKMMLSSVLNDNLSTSGLVRAFFVPRESIWGHFWFLPMIFFLGFIGYGILKILLFRKTFWIFASLLLCIGIFTYLSPNITGWFSINDIVHYFLYFIFGIICGGIRPKKYIRCRACIALGSGCLGLLLFLVGADIPILRLLVSFCLIYAVLNAAILLSRKFPISRYSLYAQTYPIFILSWPCQLISEIILERLLHLGFYAVFPCGLIIGLCVPLMILRLIDLFEAHTHTNLISFLIGRGT